MTFSRIFTVTVYAGLAQVAGFAALPDLPTIPSIPAALPVDSVPMADSSAAPETKLDLRIASGPFEPTWESIEKNYPGEPAWLREAKFGIWVHFGPQAAGESGDWYARHLYKQGHLGYRNHLRKHGHPSEAGYKEVLRGKLRMLPGGKLGRQHAEFAFSPRDFRFTVGADGALYAICLTVPEPGVELRIRSLGAEAKLLGKAITGVRLLGHEGEALAWRQEADALVLTTPAAMPFSTAVVFRIE